MPTLTEAPLNDGTRREFVAGGLSLGALLLTGCGGSGNGSSDSSDDAVTISHKYGRTRVPGRPKRVACVGTADHDAVLAFGVTPVLVARTVSPKTFHAWNEDKVGSPRPAELPPSPRPDVERVAAQNPDLILCLQYDLSKSDYEKLSKIAPTIAPDGRYQPYATPWQSMTRVVGKALGESERAERLVADTERQVAATQREHPGLKGSTVLIATENNGTVGLNGPGILRYSVFKSLGLVPRVPGLGTNSQRGRTLSLEQLDDLNAADVVIWLGPGPQRKILDQATYRRQPVHTQGRELFPSPDIAPALAFPSVLSVPYAAKQFAPDLAAAADRDPATKVQGAA